MSLILMCLNELRRLLGDEPDWTISRPCYVTDSSIDDGDVRSTKFLGSYEYLLTEEPVPLSN